MESRKRLRPWLWNMINAEKFGLRWIDKGREIFSIPWVHRRNPSWDDSYCQIFKEWAKVTKKYKEGEPEDWPGWKTRLRTALKKLRDFEELNDLHKLDIDKPYKVYRFVPESELKDNSKSDSSSNATYSPGSSQATDSSPASCASASPHQDFDALLLNMDGQTNSISPTLNDLRQTPGDMAGNIPTIINSKLVNLPYNILEDNAIPMDSQAQSFNDCEIYPPSLEIHNENRLPSDLMDLDSGDLVTSSDKLPSGEINKYKLSSNLSVSSNVDEPQATIKYKIYYLDHMVKEGYLYDEGARFYFGDLSTNTNLAKEVVGPHHLQQIQFPDIMQLNYGLNKEQQTIMQNILLKMRRGFLLQCHCGSIYAQRLCRAKIYASGDTVGKNILLDRTSKSPSRIFDLHAYQELYAATGTSPSLILTFAQEFHFESMSKLLIRMEVTAVQACKFSAPNTKPSLLFSGLNSEDKLCDEIDSLKI